MFLRRRVIDYFVLSLIVFNFWGLKSYGGNLQVAPAVVNELNLLLEAAHGLHEALVEQKQDRVELGVRDTLLQIDRARDASAKVKEHERRHLVRVLESAKTQFELVQSSSGEARREHMEQAFNQMVNLLRVYRLDRTYGIFYCPKDNTTWVQKGWKGTNPFRPNELLKCGIRVPK